MIKGLVGAVYKNDTAPTTDNIALLFDWVLEVEHRKGLTYGPELHAVSTGWSIKAEAYWAAEKIDKGQVFVRLFIGKDKDLRCLAGQVELPTLQKTDGICESSIKLNGTGGVKCETKP
jgi:hypothetical protein